MEPLQVLLVQMDCVSDPRAQTHCVDHSRAHEPVGNRGVIREPVTHVGLLRTVLTPAYKTLVSNDHAPNCCVKAAPNNQSHEPVPG